MPYYKNTNTNGWKGTRDQRRRPREYMPDVQTNVGLPNFGALDTAGSRTIPCRNRSHAVAMAITLNKRNNTRSWLAFQLYDNGSFLSLDADNVIRGE